MGLDCNSLLMLDFRFVFLRSRVGWTAVLNFILGGLGVVGIIVEVWIELVASHFWVSIL